MGDCVASASLTGGRRTPSGCRLESTGDKLRRAPPFCPSHLLVYPNTHLPRNERYKPTRPAPSANNSGDVEGGGGGDGDGGGDDVEVNGASQKGKPNKRGGCRPNDASRVTRRWLRCIPYSLFRCASSPATRPRLPQCTGLQGSKNAPFFYTDTDQRSSKSKAKTAFGTMSWKKTSCPRHQSKCLRHCLLPAPRASAVHHSVAPGCPMIDDHSENRGWGDLFFRVRVATRG